MKTCPHCSSITFDDMDMCYDCMTSFETSVERSAVLSGQTDVAKLKVVLSGYFTYEMLLKKSDGHSLSIGSAPDNAIVIPQPQVAAHEMDIFFAQGHLWVEQAGLEFVQGVKTNELVAVELQCLQNGSQLKVGDAEITLIED